MIFILIISGITATPALATTSPCSLSVSVSSQSVNSGGTFTVNLLMTNTVPVYSWQVNVTYDSSKLTYNSYTEGTFLNSQGTTISMPPNTATAGVISGLAYSLTGSSSAPATTNGILATISFTAKTGVSGSATIGLTNVKIMDPNADTITGVTSTDGSITIGSAAQTPTINSFTPVSGGTGTSVVITGTNFTGATAVSFGGTTAQSFTVNSATQITAIVSSGTTGAITIVNGSTATSSSNFTFTTISSPTITSFTPASGGTGTSVVITGTNFTGATAVSFGGTAAQSFTVNSVTQITAIVSSGTNGAVHVTTPGGTASLSGFTFTITTTTTSTTTSTSTTTTQPVSTTTTTQTTAATTTTQPQTTASTYTTTDTQTTSAQANVRITTTTSSSRTTNTRIFDITDYIDTAGVLQADVEQGDIRYAGNNQIVTFDIKTGTRITSSDGTPVESLTFQAGMSVPPSPEGKTIVSAIEFGPTGITFSKPAVVVFQYDANQVPKGVGAGGLALYSYDTETAKWISCDYSVDAVNHQITAYISHFSLYAVIANKSSGVLGMGWSVAGLIIIIELIIGGLIVYLLLQRKRPLIPAETVNLSSPIPLQKGNTGVVWDDVLQRNFKTENPNAIFKTNLTITGGKLIIPSDGKSADIELVNNTDAQIIVSFEYDPILYPQGKARIMVLGTDADIKKVKENINETKNKQW